MRTTRGPRGARGGVREQRVQRREESGVEVEVGAWKAMGGRGTGIVAVFAGSRQITKRDAMRSCHVAKVRARLSTLPEKEERGWTVAYLNIRVTTTLPLLHRDNVRLQRATRRSRSRDSPVELPPLAHPIVRYQMNHQPMAALFARVHPHQQSKAWHQFLAHHQRRTLQKIYAWSGL